MRRRWTALVVLVIAAGATWASVSLAAGGSTKARVKARAAAVGCQPTNPQPKQPLEMNTVVTADDVAKTVAMEKELFTCQDPARGTLFNRDVETFVEIIERVVQGTAGPTVQTAARRVIVATCDKNFVPDGNVQCRTANITLPTAVATNPLKNCRPQPSTAVVRTPDDPVEMNTAVMGEFIKTIKLEKEVLNCDPLIGDVYLFTEVIERRTAAAPIPAPFSNRFEGIMCRKDPRLGTITGCFRFTTQ